jgi:hypothetical protein
MLCAARRITLLRGAALRARGCCATAAATTVAAKNDDRDDGNDAALCAIGAGARGCCGAACL